MKHTSLRRVRKSTNSTGANIASTSTDVTTGYVDTSRRTNNRTLSRLRSTRLAEYPLGTVGSNLLQRYYVKYLVERYHRSRQVESEFGTGSTRFSYAAIFTNIERQFKAPTYFIPEKRFDELVEFLQRRVDRTVLGKRNRARGIRNYVTPEEFAAEQMPS